MNIQDAIDLVHQHDVDAGDGEWLEAITASCGNKIRERNLQDCWLWEDWPDRETKFPNSRSLEDGIDAVGQRMDGKFVAIQCKAKGLGPDGKRR